MTTTALIGSLADELAEATRTGKPIPPLSERHPGLSVADAYAVQHKLVAGWLEQGARLVGYKVGLTSAAMREQLGVDQPDSGVVLDRMVLCDGAALDIGPLIAPRVEAEIAFVLGAELSGPVTRYQAAAAVESVAIAIEVIDSRIDGWRIRIVDTVADNASSAYAAVGWPVPLRDAGALPTLGTVLRRDAEIVTTGAGAAVLGDPFVALVWLADTLGGQGRRLAAGQIVLSGAVHAAVPVAAGDVVTAEAAGLGSVSIRLAAES